MQTPEDLNDLRLVAAIHHTGSLAGAARQLNVNHATVFRRLQSIESNLGVRLFERENGRYSATPAGEELAAAGEAIDALAAASVMKVAGQDLRPTGTVRITTTDSVAQFLLPGALASCRTEFPGIRIELVVANEMHNLSKRDADIAIRPTNQPPEHLIGKRLWPLEFAAYGAKTYLKRNRHHDWANHRWIAFDGPQHQRAALTRLGVPESHIAANTFPVACAHCEGGHGLAILPRFIGDKRPGLKALDIDLTAFGSEMWLLAHPDVYKTARVKSVFQILLQHLVL